MCLKETCSKEKCTARWITVRPPRSLTSDWEAFGPDGNLDSVAIRLGKAQHLSYDPCPEESENH